MRKLLLVVLVLSSPVSAEVIECPKHLSAKEVTLSEVPSGQKGRVRLRPVSLSYAYVQIGELYSLQVDAPPGSKKVKGGWDTAYRFTPEETKWLVCVYGGNEWNPGKQMIAGIVEWWGSVDQKATSCMLQVREIKERSLPAFYTATATCK